MSETELEVAYEAGDFALRVELGFDERVAVLFGPSGAGKSTLLEAVLGLRPQARCRVRLGGAWLEDATRGLRVPIEARRLGWVPQDAALLPHLDVRGNLTLAARRAGSGGAAALTRAVEVLEIDELLGREVTTLSGGERQRVALARALASAPRALLLDEPLASLDLPLRARVLPYLLRVRDELALPMLWVTHDPDEAQIVGERLIALDRGRVVASGPVREVLWSRALRPLSESLGLENVLEGTVEADPAGGERVRTRGGLALVVPDPPAIGTRVRLGLRADDVILAAEAPGRVSARNVIAARVAHCDAEAGAVRVHLDAGEAAPPERLVARVTQDAARALELVPGARVHALIKAWSLRRLA